MSTGSTMKSSRTKTFVLSVPQRLALPATDAHVKTARGWQPIQAAASGGETTAVFPLSSWRLSAAAVEEQLRTRLSEQGVAATAVREAKTRGPHGEAPAVACAGLTFGAVSRIARQLDLHCAWHAAGAEVQVAETCPVTTVRRHPVDAAAADAPTLIDVLTGACPRGPVSPPAWTTAAEPGWVAGGALRIACEDCRSDLNWFDWWHARAEKMRNSWFVYCSHCGGPVRRWGGRDLLPLVRARRQLDVARACDSSSDGRRCYIVEVDGLGPDHYYVGETGLRPDERIQVHRDRGKNAAKIFKKPGVSVGRPRPDLVRELLPEAPTDGARTLGRRSALAAEQWLGLSLAYRGHQVHGGH